MKTVVIVGAVATAVLSSWAFARVMDNLVAPEAGALPGQPLAVERVVPDLQVSHSPQILRRTPALPEVPVGPDSDAAMVDSVVPGAETAETAEDEILAVIPPSDVSEVPHNSFLAPTTLFPAQPQTRRDPLTVMPEHNGHFQELSLIGVYR